MSLSPGQVPPPVVITAILSRGMIPVPSPREPNVQRWQHPTGDYGITYVPSLPVPWGYWWDGDSASHRRCVWAASWEILEALLDRHLRL